MSVEQTTQLIQLVLNSVLMAFACTLLLNRISLRQTALEEQLHTANRQCVDLLGISNEGRSDVSRGDRATSRVLQAKKYLRQLQHRYQVIRYGVLANAYALLCAIASTLALALRALVNLEWLVPLSLGLFVLGVTLLLLGVGLMLLDLHTADRSLWEEITSLLSPGKFDNPLKSDWQQRSKIADHFLRGHGVRGQASRMKPSSRARVS
ncbi:MAG: DUF2721 domain-containing protein [Lyngbya sp. HA4199-MV5]|jgi:hypothetical protein|nr:DUF2721 domain-containing protein [Lyngbya sp. HA4199-MV5]